MSFIANVNLLAAGWAELEKFMKQYDGDMLKSLSALPVETVNLLAADLKLGTSNGDRKIDIDLTGNMVGIKEVSYESVTIELANGHKFSFTYNDVKVISKLSNEYLNCIIFRADNLDSDYNQYEVQLSLSDLSKYKDKIYYIEHGKSISRAKTYAALTNAGISFINLLGSLDLICP